MEYLKGSRWVIPYRIAFVIVVFIGSVIQLDIVWNLADCMNALMAIPNLISLLALNGIIVHETRKYLWQNQLDQTEDSED
jgi:AGCS family alanine or glycine:cation symporter